MTEHNLENSGQEIHLIVMNQIRVICRVTNTNCSDTNAVFHNKHGTYIQTCTYVHTVTVMEA